MKCYFFFIDLKFAINRAQIFCDVGKIFNCTSFSKYFIFVWYNWLSDSRRFPECFWSLQHWWQNFFTFLLKIRTGFVSHSNEVRNPCSQYFSSKYFEHVAECFIGIQCWWFPKCGLESTNQKPGLNPF